MIYTSEQYERDKRAMLAEFNRAIAGAVERCKAASPIPRQSAVKTPAPGCTGPHVR